MPIRRGWSSVADIVTLALEELEHRGGADALALAGRSVSGEADGTALIAGGAGHPHLAPPLLSHGRDSVGKPYRWNGQVYRLWQQHDATGQPGLEPGLGFLPVGHLPHHGPRPGQGLPPASGQSGTVADGRVLCVRRTRLAFPSG